MRCSSPGTHDGARVGTGGALSSWHCPAQVCRALRRKRGGRSQVRGARSHRGRDGPAPVRQEHTTHRTPPCAPRGRSELGEALCSSCTKNDRSGDGSEDVSLLCAAVATQVEACGKLGDRVLLVLPVGPGAGLRKMALEANLTHSITTDLL